MHELRQKQDLCDVIINIENQKFSGHKVVLASCSPYLHAMFTNGMLETQQHEVGYLSMSKFSHKFQMV